MKNTRNLMIVAVATLFLTVRCNAQKDSTSAEKKGNRGGGPPSVEEIMKMDANGDGLLAKSELSGPLKSDFAKIDTNKDGFLSKEEVKNAPKPQRGQGPPRN